MFADFAIISILLVIAHLLRSRIRLLQQLLIPAPILAGFLGLIGGPQLLDWLPFSLTPEGKTAMERYPYELIAILFATLFLGHQPRRPSLRTMFLSRSEFRLCSDDARRLRGRPWHCNCCQRVITGRWFRRCFESGIYVRHHWSPDGYLWGTAFDQHRHSPGMEPSRQVGPGTT